MRYRAAAVVLALAAAVAIGQVPMYSDYPWGLLNNGVDQGPVYNLNCKPPLWCSIPSTGDGVIQLGDGGALPVVVAYAMDAGFANSAAAADLATYARDAGFAVASGSADTSLFAFDAGAANFATAAGVAVYALDAGRADYAPTAGYAASAGTATTASTADVAAYALDAGKADYATSAGSAGAATTATYAADAGNLVCVGCIIADRLGLGAVIREKIDFGAIDHTRVADGGLLGNNITPGGIGTPQLASQSVTNGILGPNAITSDKIDAGAIANIHLQDTAVTKVYRGTTVTNVTDLYNFSSDTLDIIKDGANFGRPALPSLDGGYIISVKRGGTATPTEFLFKKAATTDPDTLDGISEGTSFGKVLKGKLDGGSVVLDLTLDGTYAKTRALGLTDGYASTLSRGGSTYATSKFLNTDLDTQDALTDGTTFARTAKASLDGGYVITVKRSGVNEPVENLFKKSSDTFASVAGTLSDGQLGSNVVNTSNIKDGNITTAKVAGLAITGPKLDDGVALSARDEATPQGVYGRSTATNCTKGAYETGSAYIRFTVGTGTLNPQVSTTLYTGTGTSARTQYAVMRYRLAGGFTSKAPVYVRAINNANTAQTADAVFSSDGNWHTAVFDISGWTTEGTLRIDLSTALSATGYLDIAYLATGNPGSGTGALISSQGNVGVGTASPTSKLTVEGGIAEIRSGNYLLLRPAANDWDFRMQALAGAKFGIFSGGDLTNPVATFVHGGSVGIGTTSPSQKLQVGDETGLQIARIAGASSGASAGSAVYFGAGASTIFALGHYSAIYGGAYSDVFTLYADAARKFAFLGGGSVGIGTSSPGAFSEKLQIASAGSAQSSLMLLNPGVGSMQIGVPAGSSTVRIVNTYADGLLANGKGIDITSGGNVLVGAASTFPNTLLNVQQGIAASGDNTVSPWFQSYHSGAAADKKTWRWGGDNSGDWNIQTVNDAYSSATTRLTISSGGNVDVASFGTPGSETHVCSSTAGVLVLCSSSDERKKEKIETLPSVLRMVLQLRPVRYEWKDKESMGKGQEVGFLAQEVMPLFPELIGLNSDGTYLLHYDKFAPILVSAIQELYDDRTALARRVQALEDKAEAAEKRLADLEARLARLEAR